jgi:MFS transporter, putative metabolite:H+ symporter
MSTTPTTSERRAVTTGRISVAARLDRIPPFKLHRRMGVAVGFGNFFDLYDIFLGGVLAAVLAEQWGLATGGKALVISSGFAGMFFGAAALGTLADRLGRRRTFLLEI